MVLEKIAFPVFIQMRHFDLDFYFFSTFSSYCFLNYFPHPFIIHFLFSLEIVTGLVLLWFFVFNIFVAIIWRHNRFKSPFVHSFMQFQLHCVGDVINCSQTKFVAIILVLSVFFMRFFVWRFWIFVLKNGINR